MAGKLGIFRRRGLTRVGVLLAATLLVSAWSPTVCLATDPAIARDLRSALSSLPQKQTRVTACVVDLRDGAVIFAKNADTTLIPASCMKLFSMAAALRELGTGFIFETTLATDTQNLYVIGDGDPAFGDERLLRARHESVGTDFQRWADAIAASGSTIIPGDLVLDETVFDDAMLHPSWEPGDLGKWYAAPVGGLNYNDNCLDITVRPGAKRGAPAIIAVQPLNPLAHIVNKCRTGGKGKPILHHPPGTFDYTVSGRCAKRWPFGSVAFPDPGLLFAESLRSVLARKGITLTGAIRRERVRLSDGTTPPSLTVLAKKSTPIADVLLRAGRDSQNLFAECLLKRAGYALAVRTGRPDPRGSWSLGRQVVLATLRSAGIATKGLVIADGSGLSRDNACTARQLALLLAHVHAQPFGPLFRDSLSEAGVDGSLRRRLKDIAGRVHAKTGTMTGVRGLAGYVGDDDRPRYAFAVLFNGYHGPSTPYKKIQDKICRVLAGAATRSHSK